MTIVLFAIYLIVPLLIVIGYQRFKIVRQLGTVIVAYAVGLLMSLSGFMHLPDAEVTEKMQTTLLSISVPIAIPLMLFNCNFRLWARSLKKTTMALVCGILALVIAVISAYFIFRNSGIESPDSLAALMVGIYTGGTLNFFAINSVLHVQETTLLLVYGFEMVVTFPFLVFIVAGGYKLIRRALPFADAAVTISDGDKIDTGVENYGEFFSNGNFRKAILGLLLSIAFVGVGAGLSILIYGKINELVVILTITTLAILASFNDTIRNLPKTFELGMIFILLFCLVAASKFDISTLNTSALTIMFFELFIMLTTIILHIIFCRFFRISGDLFTVASVGLLCSPPFIPPVVAAIGNKKVLISGIVIGLVGYAIGTYVGMSVVYLIRLF